MVGNLQLAPVGSALGIRTLFVLSKRRLSEHWKSTFAFINKYTGDDEAIIDCSRC